MKTEQVTQLKTYWRKRAWSHQLEWFETRDLPVRSYVVDPMMGATYAMAIEALCVYLETGRKQWFVAPTTLQAEMYRAYLKAIIDSFGWDDSSLQGFVFKSYAADWSKPVEETWDLYAVSYLFMHDLEALNQKMMNQPPIRQTWISVLPLPCLAHLEHLERFKRSELNGH